MRSAERGQLASHGQLMSTRDWHPRASAAWQPLWCWIFMWVHDGAGKWLSTGGPRVHHSLLSPVRSSVAVPQILSAALWRPCSNKVAAHPSEKRQVANSVIKPSLKCQSTATAAPVPSTTSWPQYRSSLLRELEWGGRKPECYLESVSDDRNNLGHSRKIFLPARRS